MSIGQLEPDLTVPKDGLRIRTRPAVISEPTYAWDPETYDRVSAGQRSFTGEPVRGLNLTGAERVIDLGCGTGWLAAELAKRLPDGEVLGLDISPAMIAYARKLHGAATNCRFEVADARTFRVEHPVDLIVSTAALHWIREQDRVLASCANGLRPGGRLIIEMGGHGNAEELWECVKIVAAEARWNTLFLGVDVPFKFSTVDDLKRTLREQAFSDAHIANFETCLALKSEDELGAWVGAVWLPLLRCIPSNRRAQFAKEVAETYCNLHRTADIRMVRIRADARRST